jgi:hypothetical protein
MPSTIQSRMANRSTSAGFVERLETGREGVDFDARRERAAGPADEHQLVHAAIDIEQAGGAERVGVEAEARDVRRVVGQRVDAVVARATLLTCSGRPGR